LLLAVSLCWLASAGRAAEVAVLKSADTAAWQPTIETLRRVAAGHVLTEYDLGNDRGEAERVIASVKGKAAILVAMGPLAAQAARDLAAGTPVVFCMVQDPVAAGLSGVPNVSGVAHAVPPKNQLAAFRLVNPRGVRVGVIYTEANAGRQVEEGRKATGILHLQLVARAVTSEREVPEALRDLLRGSQPVDALWLPADPTLLGDATRRYILAEMLKAGKPVYSFTPALLSEGALVSDGPDLGSVGEQVGELVNRIASGERAKSELLIPRAELVINRRIAEKLRIELSAEALRVANKVN
jgi:putative ABC transport system substrate-binding protein